MIPFSEKFRVIRDERRIWILVLRKKLGRRVSSTTIRRLSARLHIDHPFSIDIIEIKYRIKMATARYNDYVANARTERDNFLDSLAEANARANNKPKEKVLKRIKHDEEQRIHNAKMKYVYKKGKFQRLDRVVVIHNGSPIELTEPHRVEEALRSMNNSKYSSTNETPLMHEPYLSTVGYLAEKLGAQDILNGTFGFPINTPDIERQLLQRLSAHTNAPTVQTTVTLQEYKEAWRAVKEKRSSSMSGRHFGVYKAVTMDERLLPTFTHMFNIPFITGIPYNRWSGFLNVMTLKEDNNYDVNKLRSLILGEADWNMGGRVFVNRRMMCNAEKLNLIPKEHYGGRKGMKAVDAVLNKRLALDNIRLMKRPAAILSTDAANCYDRMVHSFISLCVQRLGLSLSIVMALLRPLQESRHFIRSAYGDSTTYYGGRRQVPFQGSGQGNASSSPFWTVVSSHLIDMMRELDICSTFTTAISLTVFSLVMIMYVDDNDIFITSHRHDQLQDIRFKAQQAIRFWKDSLHVTGGVVRPSKCSWVFIDFAWQGSSYRYKRSFELPGTLELEDDNGRVLTLTRNEPTIALEGLGVHLQPEGSDQAQFEYMTSRITAWTEQVETSTLPHNLNFNAMHSRILRTINYPLPTTCLDADQCQRLQVQLYSKTLPRCGISTKLPLALRYSPKRFMVMGIPEIHTHQGIQYTFEFLSSYETGNTTSEQIQIALEVIQLMVGLPTWIFSQHNHDLINMIDDCWIKCTWNFLIKNDFQIDASVPALLPQRTHDCFLMERINTLDIPAHDKARLNLCRIYLQAITLSDITDAGGIQILEKAMLGQRDMHRVSNLNWPSQGRPCEQDWKLWRYHLTRLFSRPRSKVLLQPLGQWTTQTHQRWEWWYDDITLQIYHQQGPTYVRYTFDRAMRPHTRSGHRWCTRQSIVIGGIANPLLRCTVIVRSQDKILFQSVYRQRNMDLPPYYDPIIPMNDRTDP